MSTAAPTLAADLTAGLKRLKMAGMRRLAPELLVTAKTQRWNPEEFLRTLVEAEIAARERSHPPTAGLLPGQQDAGRVRPDRLSNPEGHLRLPRQPRMGPSS
jgi:hypothetical protein